MKITILGSGTSTGIPLAACSCQVCSSTNPCDQRLRSSILIEDKAFSFLVDTGPDLRQQLLKFNIKNLDLIFITHQHADHLNGLDDIRALNFYLKRPLPLLTSSSCMHIIKKNFAYIFSQKKPLGGGVAQLIPLIAPQKKLSHYSILHQEFTLYQLPHGEIHSLGFSYRGVTYLPDCKKIPPSVLRHLIKNPPSILLINCLQKKEHPTQLSLNDAVNYISQIKPPRSYLIHISHHLSHQFLETFCASSNKKNRWKIMPTYDSLTISG